jgi:hypothetical protein
MLNPRATAPRLPLSRLTCLCVSLFALSTATVAAASAAEPGARPSGPKRLVEFGWDEPDTAFMRQHVAEMEATPFDGCVFHVKYLKGDGPDAKNTGDFLWETWGKRSFKESDFRASLDDLKNTQFKRFTQNFLRFNTVPGDVDWFDDFGPIVNNARLAARIAKAGRCRGILFDIEQYEKKLWAYTQQRDAKTRSWDDYAKQVRQRGREVMAAFQEEYPDAVIFLTFGYSLPYAQTGGDPAKLPKADYGMLAPFLDGMVDAANDTVRIVDGHELSYGYKDTSKFAAAYKTMSTGVLPFVHADHNKYRRVFSIGFGVWMDDDWRKHGWNVEDPSKNFYTPEAFEQTTRTALQTADEFVWIYTEQPKWWSADGKPVKLPQAYADALRKAAAEASAPAPKRDNP